ncbi:hypothetical protein [Actinomadura sp. 6N118]|uniref:hypothetical protein n=1 Tax=Actinomadura sp. 6N118 TaxID=3375151 RepID=UPI0037A7B315
MDEVRDGIDRERQGRRRRRRRGVLRDRSLRVQVTEREYVLVRSAAQRMGLAVGAYAAEVVVAAASESDPPQWSPLRELMSEVMRAAGQVRRVGVNLNQAVAALHSAGYPTGALHEYARVATTTVTKLDDVAEEIRRKVR